MQGGYLENPSQLASQAQSRHWLMSMSGVMRDGLLKSGWLKDIEDNRGLAGQKICFHLWPFIAKLPKNIQAVRDKFHSQDERAISFLQQLADEELYYQRLFLEQCKLVDLSPEELTEATTNVPAATQPLIACMESFCRSEHLATGVQAIITAEMAATLFAREVLPPYEIFFREKEKYLGKAQVDEGLKWLQLHANYNSKHALWMMRLLKIVESQEDKWEQAEASPPPNRLPQVVHEVCQAVFTLWQVPNLKDLPSVLAGQK